MPNWEYTKEPGKEVSMEEVDKSLESLRAACFKCGKELHTPDCPIGKAIAAVNELKGS